MTTTNYDEAQRRLIALETNKRAARQCRHLATDLRRARAAWRSLRQQQLPQGQHLERDTSGLAFMLGTDRLTGMVDALEDRAACFDRAAERVAEAISRAYAGEQP